VNFSDFPAPGILRPQQPIRSLRFRDEPEGGSGWPVGDRELCELASLEDRHEMIVVHDFNTGHAYSTDLSEGTCQYGPLIANGIDAVVGEDGHLHMITPAELIGDPQDYAYQGRVS